MKTKTDELFGLALNVAVWISQGGGVDASDNEQTWLTEDQTCTRPLCLFNPSGDWMQGGEIISRERITVRFWDNTPQVSAYIAGGEWHTADDPLTAAMRAFVAAKLGDEVDIPHNLAEG